MSNYPPGVTDNDPHFDDDTERCEVCGKEECKCEPGDPDGECFRGGEAAAYEAEQQAWIQRNLK